MTPIALLHTVVYPLGLALWAAALLCAFAPVPTAVRRAASVLHAPAVLVALFGAISVFHHQPAQWFTVAGKLQAGLVLTLMVLDAAAQRRTGEALSWQI